MYMYLIKQLFQSFQSMSIVYMKLYNHLNHRTCTCTLLNSYFRYSNTCLSFMKKHISMWNMVPFYMFYLEYVL